MIVITKHENGLSVVGHAHYAEIGKDIVCAAVSTLVQTLLWSLDGLTEDVYNSTSKPGEVVIRYGNLSKGAQLLVDSFFVGVQMIADNYPEYVRVDRALKS